MTLRSAILRLGSARASRAGDRALAIANFVGDGSISFSAFGPSFPARRRKEHARRVRSPIQTGPAR